MTQGMRAGLVFLGVLIFNACAPSSHNDTYGPAGNNTGVGVPTPVPNPGSATFKAIQAGILGPKCSRCHGAQVSQAGVRLDSYAEVLATVNGGSSNTSRLYNVVSSGSMPPQPAARLSSAEITQIRTWIDSGAANN